MPHSDAEPSSVALASSNGGYLRRSEPLAEPTARTSAGLWRNARRSYLKRNWRLRLETSMVSMSMTSMLPNPVSAKSLSSSQPRPPAPTHSTRQSFCALARCSEG